MCQFEIHIWNSACFECDGDIFCNSHILRYVFIINILFSLVMCMDIFFFFLVYVYKFARMVAVLKYLSRLAPVFSTMAIWLPKLVGVHVDFLYSYSDVIYLLRYSIIFIVSENDVTLI